MKSIMSLAAVTSHAAGFTVYADKDVENKIPSGNELSGDFHSNLNILSNNRCAESIPYSCSCGGDSAVLRSSDEITLNRTSAETYA
jgi:hypothetical protein